MHNRSYSLNNIEEGQNDNPSFTVPIFSVDAGITLEKNTTWLGKNALHTLEPRVFYAFAPEENQDDVPDFDTSPVSLNSFGSLFREGRFTGEDRVGDTNQITFGLTSEISDAETGDRRLQIEIGQLYLIDDLEVNLNEGEVIESGLGDFLANFSIQGEHAWSASAFLRYDHDENDIENLSVSVNYRPNNNSRKSIGIDYYIFNNFSDNNQTDQLQIDAFWPITDRWSFFGSERYSFEDSESLSTTLGFEYDGCCWKFRVVGSESTRINGFDDKETGIFVELELNSIGAIQQGVF